MIAASTAGLIGIALLAAKSGPWIGREATPPRDQPASDPPVLTFTPTRPPATTPAAAAQPPAPTNVQPFLIGLAIALGVAVLVMLALWWRQRGRREKPVIDEAESPPPEPTEPEAHDPNLPFDARAAASDIISSWEQVERTGEWAGRRRTAQQTPTEFLDRAAIDVDIDRADRDTLLHLYHQARFDVHALGADSAGAAHAAAGRMCAALRTLGRPSVPTGHR